MDEWLVIPNWEKFQHYRDRDPLWIKVYTELEARDEWRQLSLSQRGLLTSLWLQFALSRGQLRTSDIPARVAQKVPRRSLDSLAAAGFIEFSASKPLALARARALAVETEREIEKDSPPLNIPPSSKPRRKAAEAWIEN